ncbi:hypothetical protein [Microbacterium sp. ZXX196]|uniref:hypothetical protein n=1 Tax=Microbacterium sp. ZXX196 TaxID=2609291 RepID=UPI0012B77874|nr:hypothetical protein [Microbacterium sp. ZXX196]MTE24867.1 hypothetical protein [Microbacterium sp. ZXX196]
MSDVDELRSKLAHARERLEAAEEAMRVADRREEDARALGGGIPGFGGSGNQRAAQQVRSALDSSYRAWKEATERIEKWAYRVKRLEARVAEAERVRFTAADLKGARFVKTFVWHRVVRVNAKSVSVESGYSWTDRLAIERITDFK